MLGPSGENDVLKNLVLWQLNQELSKSASPAPGWFVAELAGATPVLAPAVAGPGKVSGGRGGFG